MHKFAEVSAVDFGVPLITNVQLAQRFVEALARKRLSDLEIKGWGDYVLAPVAAR